MNSNGDRIPYYGAFQVKQDNQTNFYQFASFLPYKDINCSITTIKDCYKMVFI